MSFLFLVFLFFFFFFFGGRGDAVFFCFHILSNTTRFYSYINKNGDIIIGPRKKKCVFRAYWKCKDPDQSIEATQPDKDLCSRLSYDGRV